MIEFLMEYGLFLAKTVTLLIAVILVITVMAATAQARQHHGQKGDIQVTPLNEFYDDLRDAVREGVLDKDTLKAERKRERKAEKLKQKHKHKSKTSEAERKRVFVLDFDGDVKASGVEALATEISAVISIARKQDEVVLRLESPGGQVHAYGLAASQLMRLRQAEIPLTVCVDKVAASGGYMMACTANQIVAAPFSILGSIGVIAELPNFHRALKKYDVDYEIYTAGEFKRTVTMLGENTDAGKRKFNEEIEETHGLFKQLVSDQRPSIDIDAIATGEHWYGTQCLERGMIDVVMTSEAYLLAASKDCDLYELAYELPKSMADRLGFAASSAVERSVARVLSTFSASGRQLL